MQNSKIVWSAENALREGSKVQLDLKDGTTREVVILRIINNAYLIIKERKFLFASFTVVGVQEISAIEKIPC